MTETIEFTKQYEFKVEVYDDVLGELGSGTLHFGAERWTHINFDSLAVFEVLPEGKIHRALKAKTESGAWFTLFNCKRIDSSVGAAYVIAGDVSGNFKRIEIRYSDISEWYMPWQRLDGNVGETINWVHPMKHLSTIVKTRHEKFALTSSSETSITRSGEDHVIHEHVLFCFERLNGHFSPEDMQTKALELSNLLSILIAYPLSIISVQVVCENGYTHRTFFSTFKRVERDVSDNGFSLRCFIQQQSIHDRWENIFNRYFSSAYRKVTWTRLAGMQRYKGFWEYRALGYVTLLDKYVAQRYREVTGGKKIPVLLSSKAETQLDAALKTLFQPLEENQHTALITIVNDLFAHERDLHFGEKYRHVISASDQDMVKIVNLSKTDFRLIKEVRDNIAHGEALDLLEADLERIDPIINKIVLLMTYWAFMDFGLTNDDFLRCLNTTHNSLRFRAQPDDVHIDRMTKPESFFSVSKQEFDKLSGIKSIRANACFKRSASGTIEYAEEHSTTYRNWMASVASRPAVTNHADIFGVAQERITYLSPAYIECGDESLELMTAWFIQDI